MEGKGAFQWVRDESAALLPQTKSGPFDSVALPTDPQLRDMAYISAASWGIEAVVRSVSTAGVYPLLQFVAELFTSRGKWLPPTLACIVFRSMTRAMEWRPQRFGFSVCQFLSDLATAPNGESKEVSSVHASIMCALIVCADEVRMTGGRPRVLLEVFSSFLNGGNRRWAADSQVSNLCLRLLTTIMRTTHKWRNAQQLHYLLARVLSCAKDVARSNVLMALRVLAVAVPYVRVVPLIDRDDIDIARAITPFLAAHNEAQAYAAQVLVGLIAGTIPQQDADGDTSGGADASMMAEAPPLFVTDEKDIAVGKNWVLSVISSGRPVTLLCVIEAGRVMEAVMRIHGTPMLPFALLVVSKLQSFVSSRKKNAELSLEWAHLSLVVLANCGAVFGLPRLSQYASELLRQRCNRNEVAKRPGRRLNGGDANAFQDASGHEAAGRLLRTQPADCPPVTSLIEFVTVANIIAEGATADICAAFGAQDAAGLKTAIANTCASGNGVNVTTPPQSLRDHAGAERVLTLASMRLPQDGDASITIPVVDSAKMQPLQTSGRTMMSSPFLDAVRRKDTGEKVVFSVATMGVVPAQPSPEGTGTPCKPSVASSPRHVFLNPEPYSLALCSGNGSNGGGPCAGRAPSLAMTDAIKLRLHACDVADAYGEESNCSENGASTRQ